MFAALAFVAALALVGCAPSQNANSPQAASQQPDTSRYIVVIDDEPDTVDFQCTSIYYAIATNVFDRLVETKVDANGNAHIAPSLAESWEVSDDGRIYTFHLRKGVTFSNGSPLTSSDVLYTFTRLLTHPDSCNTDIAEPIVGASKLMEGKASQLEGFEVLGDYDFTITLEKPFEAFLACLSMPGASIMDEESATQAGELFGKDPAYTVGTGSFVLKKWEPGEGMLLAANPNCWMGAPRCEGVDMRFITEPVEARTLFENGKIDILDLDDVGNADEFFIHGDIYQNRLHRVQRVAITYFALNESIAPLDDVRVRKALQLSLDRQTLLAAIYAGQGSVENGIYPHGLRGFNPDLPEIPFDPAEAKKLLEEAGYPDGLELTISIKSSATQREVTVSRLAASMWKDIGVQANIKVLEEDEWMNQRKSGKLSCYPATWTADYDDPDNFIYTFFGNRENTTFRSLCYPREDIMKRVREARAIANPDARMREYQDLERIIAQEDAAWIPLYSRLYTYVTSDRVDSIYPMWNGTVKNTYREMSITDASKAEDSKADASKAGASNTNAP